MQRALSTGVRTEMRSGLRILYINNTFRATRSFSDTYRNDALGAVARRVIDMVKPDVAHVHHLTCLSTTIIESLSLRNVPCFYTLHDYWLMCHRGQLFDQDFRVCGGPGVTGCNRCVGRIEAASPRIFSASSALHDIEHRLPPGRQLSSGASSAGSPGSPHTRRRAPDSLANVWITCARSARR